MFTRFSPKFDVDYVLCTPVSLMHKSNITEGEKGLESESHKKVIMHLYFILTATVFEKQVMTSYFGINLAFMRLCAHV